MPNQDLTAPAPVEACPVCRTDTGESVSLYTPSGAVIKPNNGHPETPTVPLPHHVPAQDDTPEARYSDTPTHSIHFWQGLAAGLGIAIFLFFIAALAAG